MKIIHFKKRIVFILSISLVVFIFTMLFDSSLKFSFIMTIIIFVMGLIITDPRFQRWDEEQGRKIKERIKEQNRKIKEEKEFEEFVKKDEEKKIKEEEIRGEVRKKYEQWKNRPKSTSLTGGKTLRGELRRRRLLP